MYTLLNTYTEYLYIIYLYIQYTVNKDYFSFALKK